MSNNLLLKVMSECWNRWCKFWTDDIFK